MKPYDIESIVLGMVLRYGNDAAHWAIPQLGPDKFIFRADGDFGDDHANIWRAICDVFLLKQQAPTLVNVSTHLAGQYALELRMLVERLEQQYKIFVFDIDEFVNLCDLVDKAGIVYNIAKQGQVAAASLTDVQTFMQTVNTIKDVDAWLADRSQEFQLIAARQSAGYTPVGQIVDDVVSRWERIRSGHEFILLPNGFPSLAKRKLFPRGKFFVLHGLSGSGKSSLVFQLNLGTAIWLYENHLPGCVAINSLEMEQDDLVEKLASILAQVDISKFMDNSITDDEMKRLTHWAEYVAKLPLFIDQTNMLTTSALRYRASGLHVSKHGPVVQIATDYGELFKDVGDSEELRVNSVFREQFRLARLINASVIGISQSTVNRAESGKSYIAGADGTRYSRAVYQAADGVVELWNPPAITASGRVVIPPNDEDGTPISTAIPWLLIQKYRKARVGGSIPLGWIPETTTFFDLDLNYGAVPGQEILFSHFPRTAVPNLAAVQQDGW